MQAWRCAYRSTLEGVEIVNVFHVRTDVTGIGTDDITAAEVTTLVNGHVGDLYQAMVSSSGRLEDLTVREIVPPGGKPPDQAVEEIGAVGLMTPGDDKLSKALCALMQIKTNAAVRGGTGRLFLPPALSTDQTAVGGGWNSGGTYLTAAKNFAAALMTFPGIGSVETHSVKLGVFSRHQFAVGNNFSFYNAIGTLVLTKQHFLRSRETAP